MIVSHKYKFIFVHINKCGGTSVTRALLPFLGEDDLVLGGSSDTEKLSEEYLAEHGIYKHSTASEIKRFVGDEVWNSYYKFATIRNPWDKIVSTYFWFHKTGWGKGGKGDKVRSLDFEAYAKSQWMDELGCSDFLYEGKNLIVDEVFAIENLNEMMAYISGKYGLPFKAAPRSNSTKHHHYSFYYDTEESKQRVAKRFANDIENFGFEFETSSDSQYKLTQHEVDFLRDLAIQSESSDIPLAHKLMSIAHNARPDGTLIKKKLNDYETLLSKKED
ncbi:sulfotransferase family 2 domain-containing protein [Alteromonas macleodii]|uniref:sulfotransferase family 2 domain-containing protein n=1 Tax=Alteromonas macleodii TaxID=28108 RepID=UPI0019308D7D|nr:sulfotransferase family 2 domain-containing protein [Alteromonas macleodii]|tara:strand:- start:7784 stop:8608 length:825 start_codon:yes stop_codon:yes gene_type:complete